jgi:thiamine pyrophosphate-dependent acetolactate synthase large subunit-like protein
MAGKLAIRLERAGVCVGTLGPGATNLVTAVAGAFLDRAPLVALTGQSDLERMHKESHQYIDLLGILRPVVKWNARAPSPEIRLRQAGRTGPYRFPWAIFRRSIALL